MKPLPPDTSITNFEAPHFVAPPGEDTARVAETPPAEGFTPFDPANPNPHVDTKPVVQNAIFQDFSKVTENKNP